MNSQIFTLNGKSENFSVNKQTSSENVSEYVDTLIRRSIQDGASDIHLEPGLGLFRIRIRVDGDLNEIPFDTVDLGPAIISRIKVLAQLNISETRIPQDGRISFGSNQNQVDLRVSTLPTQFGESVVLRVLDQRKINLDIESLGMPVDLLSQLKDVIKLPNGIFLTTGPTGSGKTTTLYSALKEIHSNSIKWLTVEDPVEYDVEGVVQVQTHSQIGVDFAKTLRAFLRHDPDKILIGEIRDPETAKIAVQASLTGHMVFSSLHTNDAIGAIPRFIDMGIEPYLVSSSLTAVMAQRLLRRLNPSCSETYVPDVLELDSLGIDHSGLGDVMFSRPNGEVKQEHAYLGRVGIFECLFMNDSIREAISRKGSHSQIRMLAEQNGMISLKKDAFRVLSDGQSSVIEVLRNIK